MRRKQPKNKQYIDFIKWQNDEIKWKADFIGYDENGNEVEVAHLFKCEDPKTKKEIIKDLNKYIEEYNGTMFTNKQPLIRKYRLEIIHGNLLK